MVTKEDFGKLLRSAISRASTIAELSSKYPVNYDVLCRVSAPSSTYKLVLQDEAVDLLYISSDRFFKIIDTAIIRCEGGVDIAFLRVSGHTPVIFSETWDPLDLGPFKQIESDTH